jgi:hypothetical protein
VTCTSAGHYMTDEVGRQLLTKEPERACGTCSTYNLLILHRIHYLSRECDALRYRLFCLSECYDPRWSGPLRSIARIYADSVVQRIALKDAHRGYPVLDFTVRNMQLTGSYKKLYVTFRVYPDTVSCKDTWGMNMCPSRLRPYIGLSGLMLSMCFSCLRSFVVIYGFGSGSCN